MPLQSRRLTRAPVKTATAKFELTEEQKLEIREAFDLFDTDGSGTDLFSIWQPYWRALLRSSGHSHIRIARVRFALLILICIDLVYGVNVAELSNIVDRGWRQIVEHVIISEAVSMGTPQAQSTQRS